MAKTKMRLLEREGRTVVERLPTRVVKLRAKLQRDPLLEGLGHVAAGVAGGAAGGTVTAVLMRAGLSASASGAGVLLTSGAGAMFTTGKTRTFAAAAAGMGLAPILASILGRVGELPRQAAPAPSAPGPTRSPPTAAPTSSTKPRQAASSLLSDADVYYALRDARNAELADLGYGWEPPSVWEGRNDGYEDPYDYSAAGYGD